MFNVFSEKMLTEMFNALQKGEQYNYSDGNTQISISPNGIKVQYSSEPKVKKDNTKEMLRKSIWLNIALIVLVVGMFFITMFGENTNILNYRYKIENEYSIWQQELEEREAIIREKEAQFN